MTGLLTHDLRRLVIENGKVVHEEIVLKNIGRARAVVNGPDGYVYVVLNAPDRIVRLVPASSPH